MSGGRQIPSRKLGFQPDLACGHLARESTGKMPVERQSTENRLRQRELPVECRARPARLGFESARFPGEFADRYVRPRKNAPHRVPHGWVLPCRRLDGQDSGARIRDSGIDL